MVSTRTRRTQPRAQGRPRGTIALKKVNIDAMLPIGLATASGEWEQGMGLRILGSVAGRLTTAFVVPLVVLGVVGLVAYLGTENLEQNSQRVDHTHQVLGALNSIETAIKDAEAGQRGFLLTDIDRYLDPYHYAAQTINSHLDRLTELTRDNPSQQERINALRPLVEARFSELHEAIELRRTQGREIALDLVRTNQGTDVTDKIRTIIIDLRAAEDVSTVAAVADDTTVAVKESERTVAQLAEMSAALQRVVSQFKY